MQSSGDSTNMIKAKTAKDSRVAMSHVMQPQDANPAGNVHGGVVMKYIDDAAAVAAMRHAGTVCVTASIDRLNFHSPVFIGDLLTLKASLNLVGKSSMEIGVKVEAEDLLTGKVRHTASAYLTFVALGENGRPSDVPALELVTKNEIRRNREAVVRRENRLSEKTLEG